MTATNHAITGAVIAFISGQPAVALPAALASHFVCDALPHFGSDTPSKSVLRSAWFRNYLLADAGGCFLLVLVLAIGRPPHWVLASVCAFLATAPDFLWINQYYKAHHNQPWRPNLFSRAAKAIQWFERPIGSLFEAAWFIAGLSILAAFLG